MRSSVDVHNFLLESEIPHELVPLKGRIGQAERVAAVLGLPSNQVGHVTLFESDGRPVAALVPAELEPSPSLVSAALGGGDVARIPPERAADLTGFLSEAMPPVPLPPGTEVLLDRALHDQEILYFPGGEVTSVLKIRPGDLVRVTGATITRIAA